jgi:Carboxypeptidase regulatory-like domain/TonB-dependent Receptor Plug Domain
MPGQKHLGTISNLAVRVVPNRMEAESNPVLTPRTGSTVAVALRALLILLVMALSALSSAVAQSSATLDGIVHDPSGALITRAKVQLKNTATDKMLTTVSNGAGVFSFSGLVTGDYELDIEASGFQGAQIAGIHLDPGDQRTFRDIKLTIGAEATVTVTSVQGQVSTDSGETSTLISSQDIDHLAIEGRDVTELLKILPGMAIVTNGSSFANAAYDPSIVSFGGAIGAYSSNGTQTNSTSILSDGMDITDPGSYGLAIQNVNYDQVAEVKVQTGSFTADTAHGPVVINAISKAGGSDYHGSLYVYGRTYQLNTVDWIAKYSGQPAPHDRQIYPGFTFGGPVRIPGLDFNRSKKLTFFAGAEEYAQRKVYAYNSAYAATVSAIVPTAGMRVGDFSDTQLNAMLGPNRVNNACPNPIYGSICQVPLGGPLGTTAQPLANGNISPYIDPLGSLLLNSMPLPNVANTTGAYNYINTDFVNSNLYQIKSRVDYALSDKTHMFLAYGLESGLQYEPSSTYGRPGPNGMGGGMDTPGGGFTGTATSNVASLEVTTVLSPSLTNQFYAGGAYFSQAFNMRKPSAVEGEPYSLIFNNGSKALPSLQTYGASAYTALPFATIEDPTYGGDFTKKQLRVAGDNVTKLIQRHTFRAGIYYQWVDNPQVQAGQNTNGSLTDYYHPTAFTDYDGSVVHSANNNTADLLEGIIGGISQVNKKVETNLYFYSLSGYVQDHWLVNRHMSIDAGVRLEHFTPWIDPHGQGVAIFDAKAYASGAPLASPGVLYHAIDASIPLTGVPTRPAFVDPRFGVVYDFRGDSKTIVRAGFGIYRQHDSYTDGLLSAQTAEGQRSYSTQQSGHTFKNLAINQGNVTSAASGFVKDSAINTRMAGDDEMSRVQTYNLVLDQRLTHNSVFELAYVGNSSEHLMEADNLRNINAMPYGSLYKPQPDSGRPDTASTVGKIWPIFAPANNLGNGDLADLTTADTDSFRPYPLYQQIKAIRHRGYANYNAMQTMVSWTPRHARISANYTWSKALGAVAGPDPITLSNDYLPLNIDRTHIFNTTYSYTFGDVTRERYLGWVANGWELAGITNFQSGPVLTSLMSSNFGLNGTLTVPAGTVASVPGYNNTSTCVSSGTPPMCSLRISSSSLLGTPDINIQPTLVGSPNGKGNHQYVDGTAFRLPALASNGPVYYGNLRGPAFFNSDLTMRKEFKIHEKDRLQVRAAAFNFINRANHTFSSLYPNAYSLNFTQTLNSTDINQDMATATNQVPGFGSAPIRTGRRIVEFSVKYVF